MERICVAIRVKPPSRQDTTSNGIAQWKVVENAISLYNALGTPIKGQTYSFDTIFGTSATNADIYNEHAKDLVRSAVSGFNGTVFAYGQTSSGKTYTMQGSGSDPGVTRLAIRDVFTNIEKIEDREFLIRVSYMEIYNEEINDLLAPENRKLQIHESIERGIFVAGLREEIVQSLEQVLAVLERGEAQRHFGETNMNVNSSRSHTIFRMVIESRDKSHDSRQDIDPSAQDAVRVSALNMVDLAGSERISKTGAGGVRLKEGAHINKSLTTLGIVINKLSEGGGKQGAHIPYRDSKLTRILQSALGGNAKTAVICTINPDEIHIDETRGTLQFASRAKRVTNCAQVNEILTDAALLKRQKREIEDLRRRLQGSPHSEDLETEILRLRNDLLKFELERERLELELQEEKKAQVERERRIKEQEQRIENLSTLVISGAMEDRELPNKKGNRRETWCPRVFNSDIVDQGFRRLIPGNKDFSVSASFDASSRPVASRRDRAFGLPPAFESLVDDESDSFWSNSSGADVQPTLSNFENVADEDTWMSLNRGTPDFANVADEDTWANLNEGHVNMDTRFSYSVSDIGTREGPRLAQPLVDESPNTLVLLEQQLKDMKLQYQELQSSMEAKIQEGLKDALTESTKSRQQLDALHNENLRLQKSLAEQENLSISNSIGDATYMKELEAQVKELENQLKNCKQENIDLRTENVKLHDQVLQTQTALEQGVQERVSMDEENKFFRERLRSLEMGIQDDCHQQCDGAFDCEDDLAHESPTVISDSNMCAVCQSTTDKNTEGYSTQVEALGSKDLATNFETLVSKVNKRRLFDSIDDGLGQALGEYELEKPQSCDEVSVEVDYGLQKKFMGREDGIVTALSCLCCRIKQLVDPVASEVEFGRKEPRVAQAGTSLKVALNRARNLASQLLKDLHVIVNHDTQCLESHLMSKGTVATNLEALQLVLLQTADVALCLFHKLCSTEPQMIYKKLQQFVHEVLGDGAKSTVIESHAHTLNKEGKMTHPVDTTKVEMDVEENTGTDLLPELSKVTGEADSGNTNVEIELRSVEAEVATEEGSEFIERLKMSGQHISTLDSELAVQSLVQKKISKALIEQLNMNHESMKAMKAEKLRLARDLENYMGALAMHDEVVAAICAEIKEFEKDVGMKRHDPSQTGRVMEPGQYYQKQSNYEVVKVDSETLFMDDDRETLQLILEHSRKSPPDEFDSRHNLSTEILVVFVKKNLLLQKSLIHAQSKLKVAEEEITQLRQNIEDGLSMSPPLDSTESLDPCRYSGLYYFNPEEERKSASEDAEEDLCNLDLQTGIEQEPGGKSNGPSDMCLDLQVADYSKDSVNNMEALQNAQGECDISVEEQRLMANMSEAEKQFTMELLRKVKALQVRLTVAEMELVEYKVEMEHFKANNLRVSIEAPLDSGDWELQTLRAECEVHKEEIRQLLEQVMTPEAELEREALFQDTIERNNRLERYLKKTERRLLRAKGWREELLKLRETEKLKEKLLHDTQARNVKLKEERMLLRQALSKAQRSQSANLHGSDEVQNMELQLTSAVRSRRQDGVMPSPTAIGSNLQSTLTPCNHARGFHLQPARPVLGDLNKNNINLLQSSLRKNLKEVHCHHDDVKKRPLDVWSNKENQSCSIDPFASTN